MELNLRIIPLALLVSSCSKPLPSTRGDLVQSTSKHYHEGVKYSFPKGFDSRFLRDGAVRIFNSANPRERVEHRKPHLLKGEDVELRKQVEEGAKGMLALFAKSTRTPLDSPRWMTIGPNAFFAAHYRKDGDDVWLGLLKIQNRSMLLGVWQPAEPKSGAKLKKEMMEIIGAIKLRG
ncbi:hypothetical protein EON81_21125 [bacterium]|nr:MAG: hypothetical protein EON81_21125 [bacterium]